MVLKNQRQELFAQLVASGKTAGKAYEEAGYADPRNACRFMKDSEIRARITELQERAAIKAEITIDTLIEMFQEDRKLAFQVGQAAAAHAATEKLAKLLGFQFDQVKQEPKADAPQATAGNVISFKEEALKYGTK